MVHREVYYGKPYKQRNNYVKSLPSTFLDKNRIIAAELNITNNEKKYSPGSNFAKWMLQEIKRLIANIMSGSRSVNTEILNYFHPMPGTENNGNRTWMAATGENEYTVIEQTGGKSFKVIQFDAGEKNTKNSKRNIIFWSGCGDYYQIAV